MTLTYMQRQRQEKREKVMGIVGYCLTMLLGGMLLAATVVIKLNNLQ